MEGKGRRCNPADGATLPSYGGTAGELVGTAFPAVLATAGVAPSIRAQEQSRPVSGHPTRLLLCFGPICVLESNIRPDSAIKAYSTDVQ